MFTWERTCNNCINICQIFLKNMCALSGKTLVYKEKKNQQSKQYIPNAFLVICASTIEKKINHWNVTHSLSFNHWMAKLTLKLIRSGVESIFFKLQMILSLFKIEFLYWMVSKYLKIFLVLNSNVYIY